jgi:hypothetical protein
MKKIFLIFLSLCIYPATNLLAQKSSFGNWLAYFGTGKINEKWSIWTEAQYRSYNFINDREQLLLRAAVIYNINPNVSLAQGYGFISGRMYDAEGAVTHTTEHRIYQQLILKQQFGRVNIQHRYRLEERFLTDDFRLRFRYYLSANIALNKPAIEKRAVYLSAYNEIFLHTDRPIFDRDRVFGGLGYAFSKDLRVEAGVITQMQENQSRGQFNVMVFHTFKL